MGDIKVQQYDGGVRMWRTARSFNGAPLVIRDSYVEVLSKADIEAGLKVFQRPELLATTNGS